MRLVSKSIHATVLEVASSDSGTFSNTLSELVSKAPDFLKQHPVLIKLLDESLDGDDLVELTTLIVKGCQDIGITVIGFMSQSQAQREQLRASGLLAISDSKKKGVDLIEESNQCSSSGAETKIIASVVRSGQRVDAEGDLIVLGQVNEGAELHAGGNVHVYGLLKGRVFAGLSSKQSIIYAAESCPQLVSINGVYVQSGGLEVQECFGKPVVFRLDGSGDSIVMNVI